jgi:hypothetical protein
MTDPLQELTAKHPELDADALADAYTAMEDDLELVRPYGDAERRAHQLVLAYLQHLGTPDWDGTPGELSDRSREQLAAQAGIATLISDDDDAALVALLPLDVLKELLTDHILLLNREGNRREQRGNASDVLLEHVQQRLSADAARTAWLEAQQ